MDEVKWDGFRAMAGRNGSLRVVSRRGWDMVSLVPELKELPEAVLLDGKLVACGEESSELSPPM
ncbi:MAG: dependent ligase domain [Gaiellales bacterium]|jgi:ATP-dependent DNA ligase|nr:dependent ligase domain [Gaiellales bacterium]